MPKNLKDALKDAETPDPFTGEDRVDGDYSSYAESLRVVAKAYRGLERENAALREEISREKETHKRAEKELSERAEDAYRKRDSLEVENKALHDYWMPTAKRLEADLKASEEKLALVESELEKEKESNAKLIEDVKSLRDDPCGHVQELEHWYKRVDELEEKLALALAQKERMRSEFSRFVSYDGPFDERMNGLRNAMAQSKVESLSTLGWVRREEVEKAQSETWIEAATEILRVSPDAWDAFAKSPLRRIHAVFVDRSRAARAEADK